MAIWLYLFDRLKHNKIVIILSKAAVPISSRGEGGGCDGRIMSVKFYYWLYTLYADTMKQPPPDDPPNEA